MGRGKGTHAFPVNFQIKVQNKVRKMRLYLLKLEFSDDKTVGPVLIKYEVFISSNYIISFPGQLFGRLVVWLIGWPICLFVMCVHVCSRVRVCTHTFFRGNNNDIQTDISYWVHLLPLRLSSFLLSNMDMAE